MVGVGPLLSACVFKHLLVSNVYSNPYSDTEEYDGDSQEEDMDGEEDDLEELGSQAVSSK